MFLLLKLFATYKENICLHIFPWGGRERKEARLKAWGKGDIFEITFPRHMMLNSLKHPFHLPRVPSLQYRKEVPQNKSILK